MNPRRANCRVNLSLMSLPAPAFFITPPSCPFSAALRVTTAQPRVFGIYSRGNKELRLSVRIHVNPLQSRRESISSSHARLEVEDTKSAAVEEGAFNDIRQNGIQENISYIRNNIEFGNETNVLTIHAYRSYIQRQSCIRERKKGGRKHGDVPATRERQRKRKSTVS